jgi:hypothetical protein
MGYRKNRERERERKKSKKLYSSKNERNNKVAMPSQKGS